MASILDTQQWQKLTTEALDSRKDDYEHVLENLDDLLKGQLQMQKDITVIHEDNVTVRHSQGEIQHDTSDIRQGQAELQTQVTMLREQVTVLMKMLQKVIHTFLTDQEL